MESKEYNTYESLASDSESESEYEEEKPKKQYEIEDIMEMLGGDKYYSMDNIMYVYHSLRDETEEAAYYMDILIQKEKVLERKLNKIKEISSKKVDDDEDEKLVKIKKPRRSHRLHPEHQSDNLV